MISVKEAEKYILDYKQNFGSCTVPLGESVGRVLSQDVFADRDFPPFDRVSMDGIAIVYEAFEKGQRIFDIEGVGAAGSPQIILQDKMATVEIMTGAILPQNADTIIPYENVQIEDGKAKILDESLVEKVKSIHTKGKDRTKGDLLIAKGKTIGPAEIAILATVGLSKVEVKQLPKVAIIATGDELVAVSEKPLPYQIRSSNVHTIQAALKNWGLHSNIFHINDDKENLIEQIGLILKQHDVLIISGGVSKGKFDYVPEVLEELGIKKVFHKVKQRPGKPLWFGVGFDVGFGVGSGSDIEGKNESKKVVFALPGNPVSSFMCLNRYFKKWLWESLGLEPTLYFAQLKTDCVFDKKLTRFLQVKDEINAEGKLMAEPLVGHGSGDLANLSNCDGFLELEAERDLFKAGEVLPYYPYNIV